MKTGARDKAKVEMYRLVSEGIMGAAEIAERTGLPIRNVLAVQNSVRKMRPEPPAAPIPPEAALAPKDLPTGERDALIVGLHEQGLNAKRIHEITGIPYSSVADRVKVANAKKFRQTEASEAISAIRYELRNARTASESQSQAIYDLAERVERLEELGKRIETIVPAAIEERIRDLTAQRDLYRGGAASQAAKVQQLEDRLRSLGFMTDEECEEQEESESDREPSQDMDGEGEEAADEESEADAAGRAGLE